jgi:hypothetical protein
VRWVSRGSMKGVAHVQYDDVRLEERQTAPLGVRSTQRLPEVVHVLPVKAACTDVEVRRQRKKRENQVGIEGLDLRAQSINSLSRLLTVGHSNRTYICVTIANQTRDDVNCTKNCILLLLCPDQLFIVPDAKQIRSPQ